jgi:hypothetical protein
MVKSVSKRELVAMDFFRGVASMAQAIEEGTEPLINVDFLLHVNEMAIAIQEAGRQGAPYVMKSSFEPREPLPATLSSKTSYAPGKLKKSLAGRLLDRLIARAHEH